MLDTFDAELEITPFSLQKKPADESVIEEDSDCSRSPSPIFFKIPYFTDEEQEELLTKTKYKKGHIIMLAEDHVWSLGVLIRQIASYFGHNARLILNQIPLQNQVWQTKKFIVHEYDKEAIICVANGQVVCEITKLITPSIVITDQEMPEKHGSYAIEFIRKLDKLKSIQTHIALHTTKEMDDFTDLMIRHNVFYIKKGARERIIYFLDQYHIPSKEPEASIDVECTI